MSAQNIFRTKHESNFVVLPNAILTNATLSGNAKALLSYLLSRPSHWKVRITDLQNVLKVGRDRVYRYLRELVAAGYATMTLIQKGVRWQFFDTPQTSLTPDTIKPVPEFHLTEIQQAERQEPLERTYTSSLESNYEQQQVATTVTIEPAKSAEAPLVVVLPDEIEQSTLITPILNHEIQQTEVATLAIEVSQPAPAVLSECDNAIPDQVIADPLIIAEIEKLPVTQAIKPSLIKTLAALTLVEAKSVLAILSRAIVLGKVQNPVGYAIGLVRACKDGTLTPIKANHQPTLSERLAKQEEDRKREAERGKITNEQWVAMMRARGIDVSL